jgi:hypothetical protein
MPLLGENGVVLFGAIVAGTLIVSKILRKSMEARECEMRCHCGKITAKVSVRTKNVPSAECHCGDCTGFAAWMNERGSKVNMLSHNGGCKMIQLFKDELKVTNGADLICRANMVKGTHVDRLFSKCCNTPIGLTAKMSSYPMIIMYRDNFFGSDIFGPTWWRLFYKDGKKKISDAATTSTGLSASFLLFLVGRLLFGVATGRGQPDILLEICQDEAIIVNNKD